MEGKPATAARIYDYLLGGTHYFPADRAAADHLLSLVPALPLIVRSNRAFRQRAIRYIASQRVRQFLDIGSGMPAQDSVHEIVDSVIDDGRVVYVDNDPVAVGESMQILAGNPRATAIWGDLRHPQPILAHRSVLDLIDLSEPVAVLLTAVLHYLPDEHAYSAVAQLVDALPVGSYLVVSHACPPTVDDLESVAANAARRIYVQHTTTSLHLRCPHGVARFLTRVQLVEPGLVWLPQWRPDPANMRDFVDPAQSVFLVGVGRTKPAESPVRASDLAAASTEPGQTAARRRGSRA